MNARLALITAAFAGLIVAGCAKDSDTATTSTTTTTTTDAAATMAPAASGGSMASTAMSGDAAHGKTIFAANCAQCHGAGGAKGGVGPSLLGEKKKKNSAATVAWIKNPQPPMPKLYPTPLSEKDVADVASYVQSL